MGEIFILLAKASIAVSLGMETDFDLSQAREKYPILNENRAVFVTLRKRDNDELRGCIGSLIAHRALYKDIISNAKSSAFRDSRFKPLTKEEFKDINIEISLLSKPIKVIYKDIDDLKSKVKPNIDGVILELNNHRATYLPSVWEELSTFEQFFSYLCKKANLDKNCLERHPNISLYQATKYQEVKSER